MAPGTQIKAPVAKFLKWGIFYNINIRSSKYQTYIKSFEN